MVVRTAPIDKHRRLSYSSRQPMKGALLMAKVGDKVPSATLRSMSPEGPKPISTEELFASGKKVVAFALPGAFTPT
jgi:hypothetical protein